MLCGDVRLFEQQLGFTVKASSTDHALKWFFLEISMTKSLLRSQASNMIVTGFIEDKRRDSRKAP